jgi:ABC-type multidrug transport system fused ATPase/permease subunit
VTESADAPLLSATAGEIEFRDVAFAYRPEAPVLKGITAKFARHTKTALVGPSGAGKTTILSLIPRFYDVDAGTVLIDGQDIRSVSSASLRQHMAVVSQDSFLFDGSVRDNIRVGREGADDDAVRAAAAAAYADEFISALPEGYDTNVGENGAQLSGGQRQRIAIARAILKDAPILLLDEATSSLDSQSERRVQLALDRLMEGRTTIVIAHRLSTILDADHIIVLDEGAVVDEGTHAELLARGGLYASLYARQFGDAVPERLYAG